MLLEFWKESPMSFLLTIYMVLSNCIRIVLEILLVVVCITISATRKETDTKLTPVIGYLWRVYLLKSYIKTKDCRQPSILLILRVKTAHQPQQEHSRAHAAPPVRQIRQAMTEPVQVDTNAQYGYQHTWQEQGYGCVLNLHRQTSFLSKIKKRPNWA